MISYLSRRGGLKLESKVRRLSIGIALLGILSSSYATGTVWSRQDFAPTQQSGTITESIHHHTSVQNREARLTPINWEPLGIGKV